ncbi:MAG: hypothetical protein IJ559_05810 [Prevotella sp.]|nr:hypothetical protein [Prevotella sp.]
MSDSTLVIDLVLWAMYLLTALAIAAAVWSAVHGVRTHEASTDRLASRRTSLIDYATTGVVAVTLLATFLLASTEPVVSNGQPFTDTLWLRLTDMFVFTSILLICICSVLVVIAKFRR